MRHCNTEILYDVSYGRSWNASCKINYGTMLRRLSCCWRRLGEMLHRGGGDSLSLREVDNFLPGQKTCQSNRDYASMLDVRYL